MSRKAEMGTMKETYGQLFGDKLFESGGEYTSFLLDSEKVLLPILRLVLPLCCLSPQLGDGFGLMCNL